MYFNRLFSRSFPSLRLTNFSHSISSKIKSLVQQGKHLEALQSYTRELHFPPHLGKFVFPSLLKACSSLSNPCYGEAIHATTITMGLQCDPYIIASLINMYVKCGLLNYAVQLFVNMSESEALCKDVTVWNSMIDGHFRYGNNVEGIAQFCRMQELGIKPDGYSLSIVLGVCDSVVSYLDGKLIHAYIVRHLFDQDPYLISALIGMYSTCGRIINAWHVFDRWKDKSNIVVWNAMIGGFCGSGLWENSLELYLVVKNENCRLISSTFSSTLTAASLGEDVGFGRQVHCDVIKTGFVSDPYVCTSTLTMYAKCRLVEDAKHVFDSAADKEIELWNAMVSAYASNNCACDAVNLYIEMRQSAVMSDAFTLSNVLSSCSMIGLIDLGRALHAELLKSPIEINVAVQSALLLMYLKCGSVCDSISIFNTMKEKDVIAWGSMISGFYHNREYTQALKLFRAMEADEIKPDSDVMVSVVKTCAELESPELGFLVHGFVIKSGLEFDVFVTSSLIDLYSKHGFPEIARDIFSGVPFKNLVIWNSMISCYCKNGFPGKSINLLSQMVQQGLYPDPVSITSTLVAVSLMSALHKGRIIHGYLVRLNIPFDIQVENSLIDMYIKCGCLTYAEAIFQNMSERNIVTWNSMITGYGSYGFCPKAFHLFNEMKRSRASPDDVTFLNLISSCNHSGLIKEGLGVFESMKDYKVEPRMEHYANVIDLLGRSGHLSDAFSFIKRMPIQPDRSVWLSLLSACRVHHNTELGEEAGDELLRMEPTRGSNYVQLLSLYEKEGMREKAANLRVLMRQKGLKKTPGCSWIEVENKVEVFFSGDPSSTPRTVDIYETLWTLRSNMRTRRRRYHHEISS